MIFPPGGMVHFWDRKTTKLLRSLRVHETSGSLPSVAWNNANRDQLMIASETDDGAIEIWTAPWNGNEENGQQALKAEHLQSYE